MTNSAYKALTLFCLSSLVVACGGGGGHGGNNPNRPVAVDNQADAPALAVVAQPQEVAQPENNVHVASPANNKVVHVASPANKVDFYSAKPQTNQPKTPFDKKDPTWYGESVSKGVSADFSYHKDAVPTYFLYENPKAVAEEDPNIIKKEIKEITLTKGINQDSQSGPHYVFNLLDEDVYYGFYRNTQDMNRVENIYVYAFKKENENHNNLHQLTAHYEGKFLFATSTNPNLPITGRASLNYKAGKATGQILERDSDEKLFEISIDEKPNQAVLSPKVKFLPGSFVELDTRAYSPDRIAVDLHFIKGEDNQDHKYIVGKGGNEKYWGVLGLEKKEAQQPSKTK
ncbi:hypothetical protein [Pasteurella sp. PK-2025]|uniref:hypothetical protein n=1 Tax=Pasteurella sp. PK-2025 TaxID=3413133 RepID=UPI003C713971